MPGSPRSDALRQLVHSSAAARDRADGAPAPTGTPAAAAELKKPLFRCQSRYYLCPSALFPNPQETAG
jgi:hypothetical protein